MDAYLIKPYPDPYEAFGIAQAYRVENMIYMSGQVSIDEQGQVVGAGDMAAQTAQAFANVKRVLEKAGSNLGRVVKMTVYVTDMSKINEYADVRMPLFGEPKPAETIVQVAGLALPDLMIEIDAIALVDGIRRPALPPE